MIFEHRLAETGETETGKLLYASLDRGGKKLQMMRWTLGGREQFFDASGEATQTGLMRTPVAGARLTSGFGLRLHPMRSDVRCGGNECVVTRRARCPPYH